MTGTSGALRYAHVDLSRTETAPTLRTARVTAVEKDRLLLGDRGEARPAWLAASCLLRPEPGDEVLYTPLPDGRAFVLSVLARGQSEARLTFPHGLKLESRGRLHLESQGPLQMRSPQSSLESMELQVDVGRLEARAGLCSLLAGTVRAAGERMESCFAKWRARLGSCQRIVAEHDDTQAGSSRLAVTGSAVVQGESIHHTASAVVRVDAREIHLA